MNARAMLVAVALTSLVVGAQASELTGNELFDGCQHYEGWCFGYIAGVTESLPSTVCAAPKVTIGQLKDIVVSWLRDHAEQRHLLAKDLVFEALKEKFPCQQ